MVQLIGAQVRPPSKEKSCSQTGSRLWVSRQQNRATIVRPSCSKGPSNVPTPSVKRPSTGGSSTPGWLMEAHQMRQMSRLGSYRRRLCPLNRRPSGRVPEVSSALPRPSRIGWAVATLVELDPLGAGGVEGVHQPVVMDRPGAHQEVEVVTRAHVAPSRDQCGVAHIPIGHHRQVSRLARCTDPLGGSWRRGQECRRARRGTTELTLSLRELALLDLFLRHPGEVIS